MSSAIRGKRGQRFLFELGEALDALPEKKLVYHDFQRLDGTCCALGAVGKARGIDMKDMDPEAATEDGTLVEMFNIADALVREIESLNDDYPFHQNLNNKARWVRMRAWVKCKLKANYNAAST